MPQLRNVMTSDVITVQDTQTVQEAAALMRQHNIGAIPVVNSQGNLVGMLTDRDITLRSTAQGEDAQTSVSEVMSSRQVVNATPDMNVQQAAKLMAEQQIRRLPVCENGKIVGMVSLGDLAVDNMSDQAAGEALTNISEPSEPQH